MEIILFSAWLEFVSGQAAIHSIGQTPLLTPLTEGTVINSLGPTSLIAPLTEGNVIAAPLALGEWYGHLSQVEVVDKKTLEKQKFDLVLLPAFTITEDDVRAARKSLSLDPLYVLEIDLPAESDDEDRRLSIMTGKPFSMSMDIANGSRRLLIVCPKGTFHFALFARVGKKIAGRTFVLSGPERWERMSFGE